MTLFYITVSLWHLWVHFLCSKSIGLSYFGVAYAGENAANALIDALKL